MARLFALVVCLLFPVVSCCRETTREGNGVVKNDRAAIRNLLANPNFSSAQVGYERTYKKIPLCFSYLYKSPNNIEHFYYLFRTADHLEGKAYALVALHELDQNLYEQLKIELNPDAELHVKWYCIFSKWSVNKLLTQIETNDLFEHLFVWPLPDAKKNLITY